MNSRKYNFILLFILSFAFSDYCKLCGYGYNSQDLISINQNGQDKIVHQACFRCSHCDAPIEGVYTELPNDIFFHSICPDGTAHNLCTGCYRNHGLYEIADKNIYCNACHSNIVDTKKEIEKYKKYVLGLLSNYGFNGLEDVSVKIVSPLKMSKMWNGAIVPEGLTLAFEDSAILNFFLGDKKNKIYIYILENQTDSDFIGTLAHEYLHAWMMINGTFDYYIESNFYGEYFTEGFAQIGSYLAWRNLNLSEKINYELNELDDVNYGEGYRSIKVCMDYYGLEALIQKIISKDRLSCFKK